MYFYRLLKWSGQSPNLLWAGNSVRASEEFRRALLINASDDKANVERIEKLKQTLEARGFLVNYLPNARENGYPACERFARSLPARGKSIFYYCGDIDVVKDALTKRTVYLYQLGDFIFMPPDGHPAGARTDSAVLVTPKRTSETRTVASCAPS